MDANNIVERTLPHISIIIPTYNDNERLEICLDKLIEQTYPADLTEIIVVDNGSKVSPTFLQGKYSNVKFLFERKKGSYAARNKGISNSSGEILVFTDSDCQPDSKWLESGVNALLAAKNDIVVGGPLEFIYYNKDKPTGCELLETVFGFQQEFYIKVAHYTVTANLFSRRRVFDNVGVFNSELKSGGDQEWGRRAYDAGYEIVYDKLVVIYHPTRHSIRETLKKRKRVVLGLCDLAKYNKIYKLRLFIKLSKIFPSLRYIVIPILKTNKLNRLQKVRVILLASFFHYYDYWHCLMHTHYLLYFIRNEVNNGEH